MCITPSFPRSGRLLSLSSRQSKPTQRNEAIDSTPHRKWSSVTSSKSNNNVPRRGEKVGEQWKIVGGEKGKLWFEESHLDLDLFLNRNRRYIIIRRRFVKRIRSSRIIVYKVSKSIHTCIPITRLGSRSQSIGWVIAGKIEYLHGEASFGKVDRKIKGLIISDTERETERGTGYREARKAAVDEIHRKKLEISEPPLRWKKETRGRKKIGS